MFHKLRAFVRECGRVDNKAGFSRDFRLNPWGSVKVDFPRGSGQRGKGAQLDTAPEAK